MLEESAAEAAACKSGRACALAQVRLPLQTLPSKETLLRDYFSSRGGDDLSHLLIGMTYTDVSEKLKFPKARVMFSNRMLLSPSRARVRRKVGVTAAADEFGSDGKSKNVTKHNIVGFGCKKVCFLSFDAYRHVQ